MTHDRSCLDSCVARLAERTLREMHEQDARLRDRLVAFMAERHDQPREHEVRPVDGTDDVVRLQL